jgi:hypothetical protein
VKATNEVKLTAHGDRKNARGGGWCHPLRFVVSPYPV